MADKLNSLPVDNTPLNHNEISLINTLFEEENSSIINKALYGLKDVFMASFIVFIVLLPFVDQGIKKVFPSSENNLYVLAFIKTMIFAIIFFIGTNSHLMKK